MAGGGSPEEGGEIDIDQYPVPDTMTLEQEMERKRLRRNSRHYTKKYLTELVSRHPAEDGDSEDRDVEDLEDKRGRDLEDERGRISGQGSQS